SINLYAANDPAGGTGYLTDTNAAAAQFTRQFLGGQLIFDYAKRLAPLNSTQGYTVQVFSDGTPQYTKFLFEGTGVGSGQLVLTVSQNSTVLAQTSAWIDLRIVESLYEQAFVTNVIQGWPAMVNQNPVSGVVVTGSPTDPPDDKQVAVFVHGW